MNNETGESKSEGSCAASCGCPGEKFTHCCAKVLQRAKSIILNPAEAWHSIKSENMSITQVYRQYLMYLAAIPAIASFIGVAVIGISLPFVGTYRAPFFQTLVAQVVTYGVMLGFVYLVALVLEHLAPKFQGTADRASAFKLCAYSMTPSLLAGVFVIVPMLGFLVLVVAALYSIYVFLVGVSIMTTVPDNRKVGFVAVSAIVTFVMGVLVAVVQSTLVPPPPPPNNLGEDMRQLFEKALQQGVKQ